MKIKLISIALLLCMLLCGCADTIINTEIPETATTDLPPETTISTPVSIEPLPTKIEDIGQIVFAEECSSVYYKVSDNNYDKNQLPGLMHALDMVEPFYLNTVPQKRIFNLCGRDIELEYSNTEYCTYVNCITGKLVDVYKSKPPKRVYVLYISGTSIPYYFYYDEDLSDVLTEENNLMQYINIINTLNSQYFDNHSDYNLSLVLEIQYQDNSKKQIKFNNWDDLYNLDVSKHDPNNIRNFKFYIDYINNNFNQIGNSTNIHMFFSPAVIKMFLGYTDLSEYNKPINVTTKELLYAFDEVKNFIRNNISDAVYSPEIIDKTCKATLSVLKGKLYLKVTVDVEAVWPYSDEIHVLGQDFYVDYERMQQKMALEGVKP